MVHYMGERVGYFLDHQLKKVIPGLLNHLLFTLKTEGVVSIRKEMLQGEREVDNRTPTRLMSVLTKDWGFQHFTSTLLFTPCCF